MPANAISPGKDLVLFGGVLFSSFDLVTALLRFHFAKTPEARDASIRM